MRRGVFDVLRRGLDNTFANWPLILIRLGESIVFILLAIAGAVAIVAPVLVSVGIDLANLTTPDQFENAMLALASRWLLVLWVLVAISVLLLVFVALHSYVEAGSARIYVDGERIAGPALEGPRGRFAVFSMERWMAGGADGWWTVFWIYNLAWALGSAVLLVPLIPTAVLLLAMRDRAEPAATIVVGCAGLLATLGLLMLVAIATTMWANRAIAEWALRRSGARDALSAASRAVRADLGRHMLAALAIFVIAIAGSSFFGSFSMFASLGETLGGNSGALFFITIPIRLIATLLSSAFSGAVSAWFLASYAALANE